MKELYCMLEDGRVLMVEIEDDLTTAHLKYYIKNRASNTLAAVDAFELTLRRAWTGRRWLNPDDADFDQRKQNIMSCSGNVMPLGTLMGANQFGFPSRRDHGRNGDVHVLIQLPPRLSDTGAPTPAASGGKA
ncbi:hypothetical protein PHYPSEUDO_001085 [Phytophthora pseudosyringae]|uniref:Crinkler effector protein N-terminal domain-containing protein n=1 Tax=Phytophthora pseudosyringae TaxID=221518 RepID=A0A8T1V2G0_9STRA|nr:hypothetical protein PHYPSEUDO_001085 [Phytophthora pseudosyringae]